MTLAQFEAVLIGRRGPAIVACDLSATPSADVSPRAYLGEPIASALETLGFFVADPTAPVDGEVANISHGKPRLAALDLAEYRLIEACIGNFSQVSYQSNTGKQDLSDFRADLMKASARKLAYIAANYPELGIVSPAGVGG